MKQTSSNIAMQRTVDNHTTNMVRGRTKCEIDREATEYWSASILMWQLRLLHPDERGGLQVMDRAITTYHLPLNRGKGNVFICSYVLEHLTRLHRNYPYPPWDSNPTDWQARIWAHPKAWWTATSTLALILLISIIWMIRLVVEHVKIITYKLYTSSYIMIITWKLYSSSYALLYE